MFYWRNLAYNSIKKGDIPKCQAYLFYTDYAKFKLYLNPLVQPVNSGLPLLSVLSKERWNYLLKSSG